MRGWHNRRTGETVESLATLCEQTASKSQALIWYVNVDSRVPVRVQLAILWLKRLFGVKL
jgi:hypothetical protein